MDSTSGRVARAVSAGVSDAWKPVTPLGIEFRGNGDGNVPFVAGDVPVEFVMIVDRIESLFASGSGA